MRPFQFSKSWWNSTNPLDFTGDLDLEDAPGALPPALLALFSLSRADVLELTTCVTLFEKKFSTVCVCPEEGCERLFCVCVVLQKGKQMTDGTQLQTRLGQLGALVGSNVVKVKHECTECLLVALSPNHRFLPQSSLVFPGLLALVG